MKLRIVPVCLTFLAFFMLIIGCGGGGSGSSYSSSWLGITTDPNSAGSWQVELKPSAVSLTPEQVISVAVLVKDSYGHPLNDVTVTLAASRGTFDDESGETVNGWFSTTFTAGKAQGTEMMTVMANGIMASKSLIVQSPAAKTPVVKIITSSDSTLAETPIIVAAGVSFDGVAAEDATVLFSLTLTGKFDSDSGSVTDGWFSTSFTPDAEVSGVGTVTAMVNGVIAHAPLAVVKQKKDTPQLSISVSPDSVFQGQTTAVIVLAKDSAGFPSSADVNLSSSLNGLFDDKEEIITGTPVDGVFFTKFTAGKEVGNSTITVFGLDNASASTILSIERPDIVMNISPSLNSVKIDERVPVSILVTDTYLRPIADAPVRLTAGLGCLCDPESGETNDNGYMFFEFVASQTAGISTIHALTEGATASAQITVVGP
ncbi:MAG: Ig-like domain-containing protein [Candidatus Riflebacteria bacterium]|nr:Ig-like domain-containing protein [Candidatus Riflebacteria bacterium]